MASAPGASTATKAQLSALSQRAERLCGSINSVRLDASSTWPGLLASFNVLVDQLSTMEAKEEVHPMFKHFVVQPSGVDMAFNTSMALRTKLLPELESQARNAARVARGLEPVDAAVADDEDDDAPDVTDEAVAALDAEVAAHNAACVQADRAFASARRQHVAVAAPRVHVREQPAGFAELVNAVTLGASLQ